LCVKIFKRYFYLTNHTVSELAKNTFSVIFLSHVGKTRMIKSLSQFLLRTLLSTTLFLLAPTLCLAQGRCYILGDSIAQGVSSFRDDCSSATKVGLNTYDAKNYFTSKGTLYFDNLIISLGINDQYKTQQDIDKAWNNLQAIRANIQAQHVIWILPNRYYAYQNEVVRELATRYGDSYVDVTPFIGKDHIHPTPAGYRVIAQTLKDYQK
jgi:hypothetical protein